MHLSITKYCKLHNRTFSVDGEKIYEKQDVATDIEFLSALYREMKVGYPKFFKMDALSKTGFLVSELLLKDTNLYGETLKNDTGLFFCNKTSSLNTDDDYQQTIGNEYFPSPSVFVYTLPNIVMGEIAIRHKIYGENTFFISEEVDADNLFFYINQSFIEGKIQNAIVGWVDYYNGNAQATLMIVEKKENGLSNFNATIILNLVTKN
jgi:hypothetical protein